MPEENAINEVAGLSETRVVVVSTVYMQEMADDAEETVATRMTPTRAEDEERATRKARGRERL